MKDSAAEEAKERKVLFSKDAPKKQLQTLKQMHKSNSGKK